jgi:Cellulose biosynthesis protein BcsS
MFRQRILWMKHLLAQVGGALFAITLWSGIAVSTAGQVHAQEDRPTTVNTYSGSDWAKDSNSFYTGATISLQRNLDEDGFVARVLGIYGDFDYDEVTVPGGRVDGDLVAGDVMIGYQFTRGVLTSTVYVGVDYLDYDLNPDDPTNEIRGDEVGFKVAFDSETGTESPLFVSLSASYSTAFDSYFALLRLGYNNERFAVGPEGALFGDQSDDLQRLGGFLTLRHNFSGNTSGQITFYGGHQFADEDTTSNVSGGEGAYGGVSFSLSF